MYGRLFFLLLIYLLMATTNQRQLKFIEVISRHGVRYPSYPNDYDHSNITTIRNAYNELTVAGKNMHYFLGRQLYQKYWKMLFANTPYETTYHQSLILAKSTNTNRTIQSLQSQLIGLLEDVQDKKYVQPNQYFYPPFVDRQSDSTLTTGQKLKLKSFFTFPIHVEKGAEGDPDIANLNYEGDFLVKQQKNLCPNQPYWEQINLKSPFGLKLQSAQKLKPALNMLNAIYHRENITLRDAYQYYDNYICLKAMGEPYLPAFQNPEMTESLEFLYLVKLYLSFLYTDQQKKTFSTRLLANTIDSMKNSLKENTPKIVLYAAHDITIAILLASMNFTSIQCISERYIQGITDANCYTKYPAFASTFIFQLWQQENKDLTVSILINGQPFKIPICKGSFKCPLSQFQSWFQTFRVESPNKECGVKTEFYVAYRNFLFLLIIFSLGFVLGIILQKFLSKVNISIRLKTEDPQISELTE